MDEPPAWLWVIVGMLFVVACAGCLVVVYCYFRQMRQNDNNLFMMQIHAQNMQTQPRQHHAAPVGMYNSRYDQPRPNYQNAYGYSNREDYHQRLPTGPMMPRQRHNGAPIMPAVPAPVPPGMTVTTEYKFTTTTDPLGDPNGAGARRPAGAGGTGGARVARTIAHQTAEEATSQQAGKRVKLSRTDKDEKKAAEIFKGHEQEIKSGFGSALKMDVGKDDREKKVQMSKQKEQQEKKAPTGKQNNLLSGIESSIKATETAYKNSKRINMTYHWIDLQRELILIIGKYDMGNLDEYDLLRWKDDQKKITKLCQDFRELCESQ